MYRRLDVGTGHIVWLSRQQGMSNLIYDDEGGLRPWVTYAAITLAVFAGGYFLYGAWKGEGPSYEVTLKCMTDDCGYERTRPLEVGESIPLHCSKCDGDSVVPCYKCSGCGTPVILNESRGLVPPAICPKCGQEVWHGR